MVNEERIKLMTKMAAYEKEEHRKNKSIIAFLELSKLYPAFMIFFTPELYISFMIVSLSSSNFS